ncbi:MarR family transcriptional regulator [Desemzia sp. RIT804]|uniref:MarR family winged helix-turn-helix transcriptional regulator n=1 Tax=Desemzia sp. RIT 804 TaxID=2810209 RepID=UPI00195113BB|nr:MarR family transcriptional regulator [Desemzia sp. RIT 804]MBM6614580.1 MarR family transcriptional regulator [Desemzia sp. RIT 804]
MKQKDIVSSVMHLSRVLRRRSYDDTPQKKGRHGQFRILRHLLNTPGMTASELAELLDIRAASVSEVTKRLEADGLIEKRQIESDKRKQGLHLTETGHQRIEDSRQVRKKEKEIIETILNEEERETFINLCEKLTKGLQKGVDA